MSLRPTVSLLNIWSIETLNIPYIIKKKVLEGATIAPLILSSDKTQLMQFQGDKKGMASLPYDWELLWRQPSAHATILVGYLPIAKLDYHSEATCSLNGYHLLSPLYELNLWSLNQGWGTGCQYLLCWWFCLSGFPILAAYVVDYPEQCLVACCMDNWCPCCVVKPPNCGSPAESLFQDVKTTLETLTKHQQGRDPPKFKNEGLHAIYQLFWAKLPHCDIFSSITPNLLHQLHKGVFKNHLAVLYTAPL